MPLILDVTLRASVLLLLASLAVWLARRGAAAHRAFAWTLMFAGLVALPILQFGAPWRLAVLPAAPSAARAPAEGLAGGPGVAPRSGAPAPLAAEAAGPAAAPEAPAGFARLDAADGIPSGAVRPWLAAHGWDLLAALWLAGVGLAALRMTAGRRALRRLAAEAAEVHDPSWYALLDAASERLDLRRPVRLLVSEHATVPLAFGVRRPVILLPPDAADWDADLREEVLLHELAHVRRRDVLANLLAVLACAIYWFHPAVWLAARRHRHEVERACDDLVLQAGAVPSSYADHLLAMVRDGAGLRVAAFAVPLARRAGFEGRLLAILEPGLARGSLTRRAALVGAAALALIVVPLAALAPAAGDAAQREQEPAVGRARPAQETRIRERRTTTREAARRETVQAGAEPVTVTERATAPAEPGAGRAGEPEPETVQTEERRAASPRVVLALLMALRDDAPAVRASAARSLGSQGDTAAVNALLVALMRDASREVRLAAAWALAEIEDPRAVPGLVAALREERDQEIRREIVRALGEIESETAVPPLAALVRGETDPETRRMMVWALGEIESAEAVPVLATMLRDPDGELRGKVAWALGEIESAEAVAPLGAALQSERDPAVRETMVWALGEIEDRRAAPYLEAALRDTAVAVRRKAAWAIGQLDELRQAPAGLLAAARDPDVEVRREVAQALAEIQDPAGVPVLIQLLRDADGEVRRSAIGALGEVRSTAASEALVSLLRDADPEIRRLAARALGNR